MNLLVSSLVIAIAVAFSNIIARYTKHIAGTYINLLMGVIVATIPWMNHLVLGFNNEVFMILILAPLLFFEGQTTPLLMVGKKAKSIMGGRSYPRRSFGNCSDCHHESSVVIESAGCVNYCRDCNPNRCNRL
ncbi:hypothetical protein ACEN4E_08630 [Latilactobacillus sakei]|uniref:hypothetical protein n=1 Tax=Latilactobacillus sakei TaxID=1599 RepID=UPI003888554C